MIVNNSVEDIKYTKLYKGIFVYHNTLSNSKTSYEVLKNSYENSKGKYFFQDWKPWAVFGNFTENKWGNLIEFATQGESFDLERNLFEDCTKALDIATLHYIEYNNIQMPKNSRHGGQTYCRYHDDFNNEDKHVAMAFHTDYLISQSEMPGEKYFITSNLYLNEDYDGGEIEFYLNGDIISYKPKAGDLIVFPSNEPYYHRVKAIKNGNKFMVRRWVMYDYDGSKEWLDNQKKYGAYRWAAMEMERIKLDDSRNAVYLKDNI
jgi:2OG-Fe(II) oxygenase superfamily